MDCNDVWARMAAEWRRVIKKNLFKMSFLVINNVIICRAMMFSLSTLNPIDTNNVLINHGQHHFLPTL